MTKYTEAQAKAIKRYLSENVEEVRLRVPKGYKAVIKAAADKSGQSMNEYVLQAVKDRIEADNTDQ